MADSDSNGNGVTTSLDKWRQAARGGSSSTSGSGSTQDDDTPSHKCKVCQHTTDIDGVTVAVNRWCSECRATTYHVLNDGTEGESVVPDTETVSDTHRCTSCGAERHIESAPGTDYAWCDSDGCGTVRKHRRLDSEFVD